LFGVRRQEKWGRSLVSTLDGAGWCEVLLHPVGRRSSDGARVRCPDGVRRALFAQSGPKARGIQHCTQAILRERSDEESKEAAKFCLGDANGGVLLNRKRIAVVDDPFCNSGESDDKTAPR
jgi:hypothetical protein